MTVESITNAPTAAGLRSSQSADIATHAQKGSAMSRLPDKTMVGPEGAVVFCEGGVLDPGWKAAIAMLDLERKLAIDEAKRGQQADGEKVDIVALSDRIRACEVAVALLKVQGRRLGLDV